jgi:signal transduction histidine kinase
MADESRSPHTSIIGLHSIRRPWRTVDRARRVMWTRLSSVRARSTIVAVLVVGGALAIGGLALVGLVRGSLTEGVESTAQAQARDVASLLRLDQLPAELPLGRGDTLTQVVSADGHVLATSASLPGTSPISRAHPGEEGTVLSNIPLLTAAGQGEDKRDEDGPYLLLSDTVKTARGVETVYVAGSLHPMTEATATLAEALAVGLPVLLVLVGVLVWVFTGRALRPVAAIRAQVADISGHRDLHRRVPTPTSTDEIGRLAVTMNAMLDRLESSATTQQRFVADASHELRSPLSALRTTLEVALTHPESSGWREAASDALEEARRLQSLIEDLLVLAHTDDNAPAFQRWDSVDLDELIFAEAGRQTFDDRVAFDLHRVSGGRVRGDRPQLARVVQNLLDNARRHAVARVSVELSTAEDFVTFVVADDGQGVAPSDRQRIFERFARLDEARNRDAGGAGLGLAIVHDIVAAHGGTVAVTDSHQGARFEIRLPASEPEHPKPLPAGLRS